MVSRLTVTRKRELRSEYEKLLRKARRQDGLLLDDDSKRLQKVAKLLGKPVTVKRISLFGAVDEPQDSETQMNQTPSISPQSEQKELWSASDED